MSERPSAEHVYLEPTRLSDCLQRIDRTTRFVEWNRPLADSQLRRVAAHLQEWPRVELRVIPYSPARFDARALRHFVGVTRLFLSCRHVDHFDTIVQLGPSLRRLDIRGCPAKRDWLDAIAGLPHLTHLSVEGPCRNAEPISSLSKLRYLYLRSFTVDDLSFMLPLKRLEWLWIGLGGTRDLALLPGIGRLKYLELWKIKDLTDLSVLSDTTTLEDLQLDSLPRVTALPDLSRLSSLRRIELVNMKGLRDLSPLRRAAGLESVLVRNARHMLPADFRPLLDHPTLRRLSAYLGSRRKDEQVKEILPLPDASWSGRRDLMWRT